LTVLWTKKAKRGACLGDKAVYTVSSTHAAEI